MHLNLVGVSDAVRTGLGPVAARGEGGGHGMDGRGVWGGPRRKPGGELGGRHGPCSPGVQGAEPHGRR